MPPFLFRSFLGRNNYQTLVCHYFWQPHQLRQAILIYGKMKIGRLWLTEPFSKKSARQSPRNPQRRPPMAAGKMGARQSANVFLSCSDAGAFTNPILTRLAFLNR